MAIICTLRLMSKHHSDAEPMNIVLTEYPYGSRRRSNNGTILCYFDKKSLRLISSDVGRVVIRRLSGLLNAYLVIAGNNIITVGHRYKRIKDY